MWKRSARSKESTGVPDLSTFIVPPKTTVPVTVESTLIWRFKDPDIELGNRFPYPQEAISGINDVVDFEVRGKIVKSFLQKNPMYNHNINVKATIEDVHRIKAIVIVAPDSQADRASFEWPFEDGKENVFKMVNKENLAADFEFIWNAAEMEDIHDIEERKLHSLGVSDVKLGSKALVEFTIALWKKRPERVGCTFHLVSVGLLEGPNDDVFGGFQSPKKKQKTSK